MVKKGDTLIEVTLAVGIFSMIAVSIVAVMSSGTSGAQTALETTLAREEIDTQAEALRFIHTSYAVDKTAANGRFPGLWKKITENAIDLSKLQDDTKNSILQYSPSSCSELYDGGNLAYNYAFVINPRALGNFTTDHIETVYISQRDSQTKDKLSQASIYPRLIFGNSASENEESAELSSENEYTNLYKAEGIYVIAVKDHETTKVSTDKKSAFYDFYIRTCWYGSNANEPSTISTVIRLYDPDAL